MSSTFLIGYSPDGQGQSTNQRASLRAVRAQGKSEWAINEKLSQVLWVGAGSHITVSVRRVPQDHLRCCLLLFVDISTVFFHYWGRIYSHTHSQGKLRFFIPCFYEAQLWKNVFLTLLETNEPNAILFKRLWQPLFNGLDVMGSYGSRARVLFNVCFICVDLCFG